MSEEVFWHYLEGEKVEGWSLTCNTPLSEWSFGSAVGQSARVGGAVSPEGVSKWFAKRKNNKTNLVVASFARTLRRGGTQTFV